MNHPNCFSHAPHPHKPLRTSLTALSQACLGFLLLLLILVSYSIANGQSNYATPYAFTTFAGSGSLGGADGTGSATSFNGPTGLAVDSSGNVYVADTNNNKIRKITPTGVVTTLAGSETRGNINGTGSGSRFWHPTGVALDTSGNVYVADSANNKIRKITQTGVVTTFAGSGSTNSDDGAGTIASFHNPLDVAVDTSGNVYVADFSNHKIRKITSAGVVSTLAGSGFPGSAEGIGSAASFSYPTGVAVDTSGNVYVADSANHKIRKITSAGVVSTFAGTGEPGSADGTGSVATFDSPWGATVDSYGNIYVADLNNHKIRKITPARVVTTLAGSSIGNIDGVGAVAKFNKPGDVAVDISGNVYVADHNNNKVRRGVPALAQVINFVQLINTKTFGDVPFSMNGSASSGLPVTFSIVSGPATISGGIISLMGSGTVVLRASQAGNLIYAPAADVDQSFTISKGAQTIAFPVVESKTFGDAPFSVSANASGGLPVTFSIVSGQATISGNTITLTGTGIVVVRAAQAGNMNYEAAPQVDQFFTVAKMPNAISFSALAGRIYGDAPFSISASASSGLPINFSIVSGSATISGNIITLTGAGTVVVRASQAGSSTYTPAADVDQSIVVVKRTQTISFAALAGKTYGDVPFSVGATANSGLPVTFSIVSGPATISGNTITLIGTGTVVVRASQTGSLNYEAAPNIEQSFTVKSPQLITFNPLAGKTYRDAPFSVSASANSGLPVSFFIVSGPATISENTITLSSPGTVVVRATQAGDSSYAAAPPVDQSFTVAKTAQTITFPPLAGKTFGDTAFSVGASASSSLPSTLTILSGPATISGNTVTLSAAGTVTVRATQVGNATYSAAAPVEQSFTVAKASQSITFPVIANRLFGAGNVTLSATVSTGLPIVYSVAGGPATVNGTLLTISGAGTISVRASQAGNTNYLPAPDVTVSFTVSANTAAPSSIALSKNWFYDNAALNTEIGTLSATDPDVGDVISYSLVTGTGSTDNAKFSLSGNSLRKASTALNYDTQRTAAIRIRVTDLAGQFYEQVFVLDLVDGTPWAKFEHKGTFTENPSYVNVIFQLKDNSSAGRGINIPRALFDQTNDIFQLRENGSLISVSESFLQVAKIGEVPSKVRTVLLLDTSFSVGANLATIKNAAKTLVDSMFEQQEIAVYRFSGSYTLVKDFTSKSPANQAALKTAIDGITLGSPSTNLYGSALAMLNLPLWKESFTQQGIKTGFLVILTDGEDTTGEATLAEVLTKRDMDKKQIFTVGLGASLDPAALTSLGNAGYQPAADVSAVAGAFAEIQSSIRDSANSYYWLNYVSPKRGNFSRTLTINLKNNINTGSTGTLSTTFNSNGFTDIEGGLLIDRQVNRTAGVSSITIAKDAEHIARGFTLLGFTGAPAYSWSIGNSALATLVPIGTNQESVRIIPNGNDGTTTLTLTDTVNGFPPLTISLIIGSGVALPPQTISFSAPADRAVTSSAFQLSATASSGLPVSFSLISGPATLSGNTVTLTGATGTVTIRASQAGNASYAAASPATQSFTVASSSALLLNWASSAGLTGPNAAPTATPFNDGVPNLLKYAFNMNAAGADVRVLAAGGSAGLPQITVDQSGPKPALRVAFLRRKGSGLIYTPQRSAALDTFVSMTGAETVTAINDQWEQVTVTETNPLPPATTSFARVQVAIP